MRPSFCVCYCHFSDTGSGWIGSNRSVRVKQPAVAVVCVFTETDIAYDEKGGKDFSQFSDGEDDGPIGVICWRACVVLYMIKASTVVSA